MDNVVMVQWSSWKLSDVVLVLLMLVVVCINAFHNFQSHIPKTEIQKELIIDNRDKIEYFLRDYVDKLEEIDDLKIKNDILFSRWLEWIDINKVKIDYNYISFGTRFGMLIKKRNLGAYIKKDTNKNVIINVKYLKIFFNDNP